jgi:hypothetical protein
LELEYGVRKFFVTIPPESHSTLSSGNGFFEIERPGAGLFPALGVVFENGVRFGCVEAGNNKRKKRKAFHRLKWNDSFAIKRTNDIDTD